MGKKEVPGFVRGDDAAHGVTWKLGSLELDESRRELRLDGNVIVLEPKPLNLLMLLVRHPRELLTKDELIDALWSGRIVTESVLSNCVAKLRQALGEQQEEWILTVHGYGYRYDGPVEVVSKAPERAAAPSLQLAPGDTIPGRPHWQLVRRLGLSGDAWLAEHRKTRMQRVFKFSQDVNGLSSLKREVTLFRLLRESLGEGARVVGVLDWNFDEPPWFIETGYCVGGSLQEWLETQGGVQAVPLETRLELVAQVCDVLSAVHALGVLHKDIKPANILIDPDEHGRPRIRLGDFGSGRLLDPARLDALAITRLGFTRVADDGPSAGTPLYYAPEVVGGKPFTVQADLYALGVILFQMVVGSLRRPLAPGWEREVDNLELREDIALAAEGDPAKRLSDASILGERLRRLEQRRNKREHAAEEHRQLEAAQRLLEQLKVRRARVRSVLAALSLGLMASVALYLDARAARHRAEREALRAQAITDFLNKDMLASIDGNRGVLRDLSVKQLLDRGMAEVGQRFGAAPEIAASIYQTLGHSYAELDYLREAATSYSRALPLLEAQGPQALPQVMELSGELALIQWINGELPSQLERHQALLQRGRAELGPSSPSVMRLSAQLARARIQLGDWQAGADQLRALEPLALQQDPHSDFVLELRQALVYVLLEQGYYAEAAERSHAVIAQVRERHGDSSAAMAMSRWRLAYALMNSGRLDAAEAELAAAQALTGNLLSDDSGAAYAVRLYLAHLRIEQGRFADAEQILRGLLAELSGDGVTGIDQSYTERWPLAEALARQGKLDEALAQAQTAFSCALKSLGPAHPWTAGMAARLSWLSALAGTPHAPLLPPDLPDSLAADHPYRIDRLRSEALQARHDGDLPRANALSARGLALLQSRHGPHSWRATAGSDGALR